MKQLFLLAGLFTCSVGLFSADYSKVDEQSHYVPYQLKTPVQIAKYLTRNLRTDEEKTRAIYFWIANTIKFDVDQIPGNDYRYHVSGDRNFLKEVLDSHKGVCQHYAMLFDTLCHSVGVKSYFVVGYTRQNEQVSELSHAWNAVQINGEFFDLDVTWSAGYVEDGKYRPEFHDELYMVSPSKFIATHIPFDPVWQFLKNPVTHTAVEKGDFKNIKSPAKFNYSDSIKAIATSDTLTNLIHENQRIKSSGVSNELIKKYIAFNQRNIDLSKYNIAIRNFNKSVENFNAYVLIKNKQFNNCTLDDNTVQNLLTAAKNDMENAESALKFLKENNSPLKENISGLQNAIKKMNKEIDQENAFIEKYISTPKPLRLVLFSR